MIFGAAADDGLRPRRRQRQWQRSERRLLMACRRLAAWPHWIWPLALCVLFSGAGLFVLDDYAVIGDSVYHQRPIAIATVERALGREPGPVQEPHNRLYGAAFEVLPLFVERIAGLVDTRPIYLTRHLMTHLFFIGGGFFCYLLAYRMTGSRLLGLFAMLLFLLHPRMYGHSFFNSKDIPFLTMFMIALYCIHGAFRKGTVGAFLVCGVAVGILVNIRIMGVILLPAVLLLRGCDWYYAVGWVARRRVICSAAAFALAATAIYYATLPYLWSDPIARFGEVLTVLSRHPTQPVELFQGRYVSAADLPAQYLPVWIAITTPIGALLLAGAGTAATLGGALAAAYARSSAPLRNTALRFALLLIGGVVVPICAAIALESVLYNGWRHLYFVWAPLCLLAAVGLHQVGRALGKLPMPRRMAAARVGWAGLAAIVLATIIVPVVQLHPYQHLYFNALVDRNRPEYLLTQYEMDYFRTSRYQGYEYILDNHPEETINMTNTSSLIFNMRYLELFPEAALQRVSFTSGADADYYLLNHDYDLHYPAGFPNVMTPPAVYNRKVYNNTIISVVTPQLSRFDPAVADEYRAIYRAAVRGEPTLRKWFDFYLHAKTLTLVKEDCPPGVLGGPLLLRVYPANASDRMALPELYQREGAARTFLYGVRFDGKCMLQATLPDYDIARIVVGGVGEILSDDYRAQLRRQYAALANTEPAIRGDFAVYVAADQLHYLKAECGPDDYAAPFFLQIIPAAVADLPAAQRAQGFENRNIRWGQLSGWNAGVTFDDKCMATVPLPDYELHGIRTGQQLPTGQRVWSGEFYTESYRAAQAAKYAERAIGAPAAAGFFSVYYGAGALTYVREDCAPGDTAAPFYLHPVPADPNDLPAAQRAYGYDNRDFEFARADGVHYNGRCLVSIPLPDYAIVGIRTGQYTPDAGRLWTAEFAVAAPPAGAPTAAGFFSVWHTAGTLTYARAECAPGDAAAPFYLHLIPAAVADLPAAQREYGYDNRDFEFAAAGGVGQEGRCQVSIPLPDYAIVGIRTGQYAPVDGRRLWAVEFAVGE